MHRAKTYKFVFLQLLAVAVFVCCLSSSALAQGFSVSITVDENCNGVLTNTSGYSAVLPCAFQNDPGPGGLTTVMTYGLLNPPGLTAGDVLLLEGPNGSMYDVIRFNDSQVCADSEGCLVFYSDNVDGFDSLADTFGPPGALYANNVSIVEVGGSRAIYTPVAGQPGFVVGAAGPVTYTLISDVPEPATLSLFATGLLGLLGMIRKRKLSA